MRATEKKSPELKPWAREIFCGKQAESLLAQRANEVLSGAIAASRLRERPDLNREAAAASVANMIRERHRRSLGAGKGELTKLTKRMKTIEKRVGELLGELRQEPQELSELEASYRAASVSRKGRAPEWSEIIRGLDQLKCQAERLKDAYRLQVPNNTSESIVIDLIAPLFREIFDIEPRVSRSSSANKAGGPFLRFAQYVARETNPLEGDAVSLETVAKDWGNFSRAIKELKENRCAALEMQNTDGHPRNDIGRNTSEA